MTQKTEQLPLFVYGTLQPGFSRYPLLREYVDYAKAARLTGYQMYDFRSFPGITPTPHQVSGISGYLLYSKPESWLEFIEAADRVENEGFLFYRVQTNFARLLYTSDYVSAWVYVINEEALTADKKNIISHNSWPVSV